MRFFSCCSAEEVDCATSGTRLDSALSGARVNYAGLGTDLKEECLDFRCILLDSFSPLLPDLDGGGLPMVRASVADLHFFLGTSQDQCKDCDNAKGTLLTEAAGFGTESDQDCSDGGLSATSVNRNFSLSSLSYCVLHLNSWQIWHRFFTCASPRHLRQLLCRSLTGIGSGQEAHGLKPRVYSVPAAEPQNRGKQQKSGKKIVKPNS